MEFLPRDVLLLIVNGSFSTQVMLSLTCKPLRKSLRADFSALDCCVYDACDKRLIKECESWGCRWKDNTYYQLGLRGDISMIESYCLTITFWFSKCCIDDRYIEEIYIGACNRGHLDVVIWINDNCKPFLQEIFNHAAALGTAATHHHWHILNYMYENLPSINMVEVTRASALLCDIELVKYWLDKGIEVSASFLDSVCASAKPIEDKRNFLKECVALGVDLSYQQGNRQTDLASILLCASYGMPYEMSDVKFTKRDLGVIDWVIDYIAR
jgi:hypothetical protein